MDNVGERLPLIKFIIPNGPQNQAHPLNRHTKPDRLIAHIKEGQIVPPIKEKRPSPIHHQRPQVLFKEHKQFIVPNLRHLHRHFIPRRLDDVIRIIIRAGSEGTF